MTGRSLPQAVRAIAIGVIVFGLFSIAHAQRSQNTTTVVGTVEPFELGEDDAVLSVSIWDADEGEYLVSLNEQGRMLLELVGATVRVNGYVTAASDEDEDSLPTIRVTSFEILSAKEDVAEPETFDDLDEELEP